MTSPATTRPASVAACLPARSCSGNLLDDAALLASLNETKAKAWAIAAALEEGRALSAKLDAQRSAYRCARVTAQRRLQQPVHHGNWLSTLTMPPPPGRQHNTAQFASQTVPLPAGRLPFVRARCFTHCCSCRSWTLCTASAWR